MLCLDGRRVVVGHRLELGGEHEELWKYGSGRKEKKRNDVDETELKDTNLATVNDCPDETQYSGLLVQPQLAKQQTPLPTSAISPPICLRRD